MVYYCGTDVLFGRYCGTLIFSRLRTFSLIPSWVNDTFRSTFDSLNISRHKQKPDDYHTEYDNIHTVDSTKCYTEDYASQHPVLARIPAAWPDKFNATFVATFNFDRGSVWNSVFSYDWLQKRQRIAHTRARDGLACSYLFADGVARVVSDNGPDQCCQDPAVPGVPTRPSLFHDMAEFRHYLYYGTSYTAVYNLASLTYGESAYDGSPIFLDSMDFHGVWNFTSPFLNVTDFEPRLFQVPDNCTQICDLHPVQGNNNCFFRNNLWI